MKTQGDSDYLEESSPEPDHAGTVILDSQPSDCEKMNFRFLSYSVYFVWQPELTNIVHE